MLSLFNFEKGANMQTENKKKAKLSIEEKIKFEEEKIKQKTNQVKLLRKKLAEEKRKERTKRMIEKGAVFESIFKTTTEFTKDEFYELIVYLGTLDEIKIKIMEIEEIKKEKEQNTEDENHII